MGILSTVSVQVGIMFLLMAVGFICYKIGMISNQTGEQLSEILLMVVIPAVIIDAFQIEFNKQMAKGLAISFFLAVIAHFVGIFIAKIFISKKNKNYKVQRITSIYGNAGFMGIPLISAILPENGVFYASTFIAVLNIFIWTHGIMLMDGKVKAKEALKALKSPPIISILIGIPLFLASIKLPQIIGSTISYIANLNTALAMFVTGIYIAKTNLLNAFADKKIYKISFLKLILQPLVMIIIFMFLNVSNEYKTIMIANIIATGCPTATATLLLANRYKASPEYASKIIATTTLYSVITLPVIIFIGNKTMGMFA